MTNIFKGQISHYHNIEEFKEKSGKTLNSLVHLRNKTAPYDYFDYFTDDAKGEYIAVGYYEGEQPPEAGVGEIVESPKEIEPVIINAAPAQDKAKNEKNRKQR